MNSKLLTPVLLVLTLAAIVLAFAMPTRGLRSARPDSPEPSAATDASATRSTAVQLPPLVVEPPIPTIPGMVWIPGGTFTMGTPYMPAPGEPNPDRIKPDEVPAHIVEVDGFFIDATEVTNAAYEEFVNATGYVTVAERKPKREDFIGLVPDISLIPEENLVAGSLCFNENFDRSAVRPGEPLWEYVAWEFRKGACWKHPAGPGSGIEDKRDHPVVHIAFEDALAYCEWAGKRLPTEAEYEYAHRGGREGAKYFWGNELVPDGQYYCNYWQGEFPLDRQILDGYMTTAPVKSFPPNGYGLYEMAANVWEWCHDKYHIDYYSQAPRRNPQGPAVSFDPSEPNIPKRVTRGGSFLCNTNNCTGYRIAARMRAEESSGACHHGFRCVVDSVMARKRQTQHGSASSIHSP